MHRLSHTGSALRPTGARAHAALIIFAIIYVLAIVPASAQTPTTTTTTTTTTTPANTAPVEQEIVDQQQEQIAPERERGEAKSTVRGRVIYDDTNRPVRRARVLLLKSDGGGGMENGGMTDERGEFRITNVSAGSYFVMIDAPGIITPISSIELDESVNEKTAMVAMKKEFDEISVNGANSVEVQIRARRGGVVTGRVNYQDGDPAINAQIIILRKKDNRVMRFITGYSPSSMLALRTDDRGVFRIAGLPPGEYVVGASEASSRQDSRDDYMGGLLNSTGFGVSYYRNETNLRQATPVKVEAGQEAGEINITLIERASYTISGTVVARQGRAPVRAFLSIQSRNEGSPLPFLDSGPSAQADEQGRWSFSNIPDGNYLIKVDPGESNSEEELTVTTDTAERRRAGGATRPAPGRPSLVPRTMEVTVSGGDLSGINIELSEGGLVQGTVIVEGNAKEIPPGFYVLLVPRGGGRSGFDRHGFVREGGSFTIDKVPPGEFYFSVQMGSDNLYVKSITAGSVDLMREPVRVGVGSSVDNVRVTLSSDLSTLEGRVLSQGDAKPLRGAVVLMVPSDPARWRSPNSFTPVVTGADGAFKLMSAPGSYLLIPMGAGESLSVVNEAFIRARSAGAKAVTLQPNGRETVELIAPAP